MSAISSDAHWFINDKHYLLHCDRCVAVWWRSSDGGFVVLNAISPVIIRALNNLYAALSLLLGFQFLAFVQFYRCTLSAAATCYTAAAPTTQTHPPSSLLILDSFLFSFRFPASRFHIIIIVECLYRMWTTTIEISYIYKRR